MPLFNEEAILNLLEVDVQIRLLESFLILLFLWLFRLLAGRLINQYATEPRNRYHWRKGMTYLVVVLAVFLISPLWVRHVESLATFLGLLSAGIAISLRDLLTNLFGWIFIVWRQPFEVGDRIQIGNYAGDVVDIRIFEFTVLEIGNWVQADQSTGRVLHIPNGLLLKQPLANSSKGFEYIWDELKIHITFESNWRKAKQILHDIAYKHAAPLSTNAAENVRQATSRYLIVYRNLTPIIYLKGEQNGIILSVRYLCPPRRRRSSKQALWEQILTEFAKHPDIEYAYPTQRFYQRPVDKQPSEFEDIFEIYKE
ncbi:mechanosensitive ion channel family protein [Anaerolineales bacterium HSG6]|nr:mechanosensitive ion channel family protein [Anaerolineales bacterium HSG6]MDM8531697.1 mechanosensitive ion channel family protein [Anaerolineales bacterium HSG25]